MAEKQNQRSLVPLISVGAGIILILGAILLWMNPNILSGVAINPTITPPVDSAARIPFPNIARISAADAEEAYQKKAAVFVDVRGDPYYSMQHIPGARSITEDELPARLNELNKSDWIITYCT